MPNDTLPSDIQELLNSGELDTSITEIVKRYTFDLNQIEPVIVAATALLMGKLRPSDFVGTIIEYAKFKPEFAIHISQEINKKVFSKVKKSLIEIHNISK